MKKLLLYSLCLLITAPIIAQNEGETLFKSICSACHTIGKEDLVGPDLKGTTKKHTTEWLVKFIRSSQTVINDGDHYAVALFNKYNQIIMPDQSLSDKEIKSIIAYIKKESGDITENITQKTSGKLSSDSEKNTIPIGNDQIQNTPINIDASIPMSLKNVQESEVNITTPVASSSPDNQFTFINSSNFIFHLIIGFAGLLFLVIVLLLSMGINTLSGMLIQYKVYKK